VERKVTSVSPDANYVLDYFGHMLFDIAFNDVQGYEDGRAHALGALCRIFSQQTCHRMAPAYLQSFYRAIISALDGQLSHSVVVATIIRNSTSLFG
jgi:hypothetical protein